MHDPRRGGRRRGRLSHRYISGRQLPDKAVDLLDTAAARVQRRARAEARGAGRAGRWSCAALERERDGRRRATSARRRRGRRRAAWPSVDTRDRGAARGALAALRGALGDRARRGGSALRDARAKLAGRPATPDADVREARASARRRRRRSPSAGGEERAGARSTSTPTRWPQRGRRWTGIPVGKMEQRRHRRGADARGAPGARASSGQDHAHRAPSPRASASRTPASATRDTPVGRAAVRRPERRRQDRDRAGARRRALRRRALHDHDQHVASSRRSTPSRG